jgi:hypothetical protein
MPMLETFARVSRYTLSVNSPYRYAQANVYVQLDLTQEAWDALKVQIAETEALAELGLDDRCQPLKT